MDRSVALFVGIIFCIVVCNVRGADKKPSIVVSSEVVDEGGSFSVECMKTDGAISPLILFKQLDDNTKLKVAEVDELKRFQNTKRYSWKLSDINTHGYTGTLVVKDALLEDLGKFYCQIGSDTSMQTEVKTIVGTRPPQVMVMNVKQNGQELQVEDGNQILLDDDSTIHLTCLVTGSSMPPKMEITVGEAKITEKLENNTKKNVDKGDESGLEKITYDSELEKENLLVNYKFDRKVVRCSASPGGHATPDKNVPTLTKSLTVILKGVKPIIDCKQKDFYARKGEKTKIVCTIESQTDLLETLVIINKEAKKKKTRIYVNKKYGDYGLDLKKINKTMSEVSFLIKKVSDLSYRKYFFVSKNNVGSREVAVWLKKEITSAVHSSAMLTGASCVVLLLFGFLR